MPAPDGRAWFTSKLMADNLMGRIEDQITDLPKPWRDEIAARLEAGFASMYGVEFKILRLTEKLRLKIEQEGFGPLYDADGTKTQAYHIWKAFRDIYVAETLDQFDEEGELI